MGCIKRNIDNIASSVYMIHDRDLISNDNTDEYFKAMDDEIQSLMRRDTWEIVSSN